MRWHYSPKTASNDHEIGRDNTDVPTFQGFLVYIIDTQKKAPVGYGKALLERPEGDTTDQVGICAEPRRESITYREVR